MKLNIAQRRWLRLLLGACAALMPVIGSAHSFGTPYILPLPYWLYVYGCGGTLIVTFGVLGLFSSSPSSISSADGITPGFDLADRSWLLGLLRIGASLTLLLTVVSGVIGTQDAGANIGMTLFWVMLLLGFSYLTVLIGDLFALINPFITCVTLLERLRFDFTTARLVYPAWLGSWPALFCYLAVIWIELFSTPAPAGLSALLGIYSAVTLVGAWLFGRVAWFGQADFFSAFFRLVGTMAPLEYSQLQPGLWRINCRMPLSGTLTSRPADVSLLLLVLFMLASTTYDGMYDTQFWTAFFWRNALSLMQPLWGNDLGRAQRVLMDWFLIYRKSGLLVFPFLYLGIYLLALLLAKWLTRSSVPLRAMALEFGYSLLPIAFAYNFAHYFTFLVAQLGALPYLLSDPFGLGWNLLGLPPGTQGAVLNMGVLWHTQVAVILVGHVLGVVLAHRIAVRLFASRLQVILSQLPMLLLMVAYTFVGLWILTLPLDA